ncbi:MAG: pilus assembly protein PilZ [Lysobacterales bacterium CG02_land_8_20_14_3_00_62_12]|nr:MAG: pilus assembly protein PilZ [Xanthomonadales bacterium CG02_land_8_20_14_3_00_62_12]
MNNARRSKRRKAEENLPVVDTMTGQCIGRIGDLSTEGLMLITEQRLHDDALYQLSFHLPDTRGLPALIEIGVHEQWTAPASVPGQFWSGFRIIDMASRDLDLIADWLDREDRS